MGLNERLPEAAQKQDTVVRHPKGWVVDTFNLNPGATTMALRQMLEKGSDATFLREMIGFAAREPTPERTAFVRFRRELVRRGLDRALFEAVTRHLEAKGVLVQTGTLVDATLIPSASIRGDGEARWAGHRRRKPTHGYKAHVAADEGADLIRGVEVTSANVHDAAELAAVLPEQPGRVYADSASAGGEAEAVIRARGGAPWTIGTWGGAEALAQLEAHKVAVQRVRCRIEKVFGPCERSSGLRRMRWLGLAKAGLQVRLAAVACNLRRTLTLLHAASPPAACGPKTRPQLPSHRSR